MAHRDVIAVGASAGGIEALQELCAGLPRDLDAAILVVIHTSPHAGTLLPRILDRAGALPAIQPRDQEPLRRRTIYVAPPDRHMMVQDGHIRLVQGPRENRHRPAIDPTFRSAALSYGPRVIGVVLTGMLDDGASGLMLIRAVGGVTVIQDPETALFPSMPRSALNRVPDARVKPLAEIPGLLAKLVAEELKTSPGKPVPDSTPSAREVRLAELDMKEVQNEERNGIPSVFGCPECGGVLWEIDEQGLLRFRCRVGHAYTAEHLRSEQRHAIETALWSGLRALEENASLYRRMAERARSTRQERALAIYEERASNAERNSETLRNFLVDFSAPDAELDPTDEAA